MYLVSKYSKILFNKFSISHFLQEPAGIFDLIEVVGNGTYGQVYKVSVEYDLLDTMKQGCQDFRMFR